jgi:4-coumarate--CoA ligase
MPIPSRFTTPVPSVSLPTWLFESPSAPLGDHKVFVDADKPSTDFITMAEYRLWCQRLALGLQRAGLHPGDRVLLFSGNHLMFPSLMMGVIMAGGIFTGASPAFTPGEVAYQLSDARPTYMIAAEALLDTATKAADLVGLPRSRVLVYDGAERRPASADKAGHGHWTDVLASREEARGFQWVDAADPRETTCCLNYSSGTTGKPKGVEISHYAYVANGESVMNQMRVMFPEEAAGDASSATPPRNALCFLPMYHAAGQTGFVVNLPKRGATVYIMRAYDFEKVLQHVQDLRVERLGAAPPVLLHLAKSPLTSRYDLGSLKDITCGTASLAREIADEVLERLPGAAIYQGWGMTELTCTGTFSHPENNDVASVGETATNGKIKLMDGDREVTEPDTPGELWWTGPTVMRGYWCRPDATAETIVTDDNGDRWIRTGDLAKVDKYAPGAQIYIVDRLKDLIKSRGYQVAPAELEGIIFDHKDVVDVSVVGVTVNGDEVPRAYVVRRGNVTEAELVEYVNAKVAKYKWLRGGVAFVDAIPRLLVRFCVSY